MNAQDLNTVNSTADSMSRLLKTTLISLFLVFSSGSLAAERHALLIGIGDYPKPIVRLDGPVHDVEALHQRLVDDWGFKSGNITSLVDATATRAAILGQLDRLATTTRPGDYLFIYYSGHGTSAFNDESRFEGAELDKWTGALIPHDFDRLESTDWTKRLIVGRRDLRPRLAALDRDRNVFVIFDTCFSGNSVRSISKRRVRWVPPTITRGTPSSGTRSIGHLDDPFDDDAIFGAATAREQDYPYRRLIYMSAARKYERAEDIPSWETIDQRPHGAMTNALLKGLDGAADTDGDDQLTYGELYRFVQDEVSENHQHMPQMLYPESRPELVQNPVFAHRPRTFTAAPTAPAVAQGADELRVRLDRDLNHLRVQIERLPQVRIADDYAYDVAVERRNDGLIALYHSSGDLIASGFGAPPTRLLERLARLAQVQALVDLSYPRQHFDLSLELSTGQGFLTRDQRFDITARGDRPAFLLLLNIDKTGTVSVLYPIHERELRRQHGLRETFEVVPPYGTEYLKLFAFSRPPAGLERWIGRRIDAHDPNLDQLLRLLETPRVESAQTRLKVVTVGELLSDG